MLDLFSYLNSRCINTRILDLEIEIGRPGTDEEREDFREKAAELISRVDFDIVGISCWSSLNYLSTIAVADICRRINNNACIIVGGHHPTAVPSDFDYEGNPFDFIVCGEGETALLDICRGKGKRHEMPRVVHGSPLDLTGDLPLDWDRYQYAIPNRISHLSLSRGCPFSCSFCMERHKRACMGVSKGNRWRSYSARTAIGKVEGLRSALNPLLVCFGDPCFGYARKWRRDFLHLLAKTDARDCVFWAESRADILTKEDIDSLSAMNFDVWFGLESGSPRMLEIMNKTKAPRKYLERYKEVIQYMNQKEVPYHILIMFNHPGETYETYKATFHYLESLLAGQKTISGTIMAQNYFFSPGSHVFRNIDYYEREYGTVVKHKHWWKKEADQRVLARSVVASEDEDLMKRFDGTDYWRDEISELNGEMTAKHPGRVRRHHNLRRLANLPYPLSKA